MSYIYIQSLICDAKIGVLDSEKNRVQPVEITLKVGVPLIKAAQTDSIEDTIDYAEIVACIKRLCVSKHHTLCEHLAHEICSTIYTEFNGEWVEIELLKPEAIPDARGAGVAYRYPH